MPDTPAVSIVVRSRNDAAVIGATLEAVHTQAFPGRVETIHVDSGSTDATVDTIRLFHPDKLLRIAASDYVPGAVLNRGMREARAPWVVFLNSDCTPGNSHWLGEMMAAAQAAPHAGAVFGRQVPRADCRAVYAHDYERCFGGGRASKDWEHFFSMASSAVRRTAWEQQPFREDLRYSEDDEWSRRLVRQGWEIAYAARSVVTHSHNYTLRQAFRRSYGEAYALAAVDTVKEDRYPLLGSVAACARDGARDFGYCLRHGKLGEWPHALAVRAAQRAGKHRGFRDGWAHYRPRPAWAAYPREALR